MSTQAGKPIPCPWPSKCQCTHTGACVAGWMDHEEDDVTSPCPNCRPDLFREMNLRHHLRGENSKWIRLLERPIVDQWLGK